jgi:hypothetical protein
MILLLGSALRALSRIRFAAIAFGAGAFALAHAREPEQAPFRQHLAF